MLNFIYFTDNSNNTIKLAYLKFVAKVDLNFKYRETHLIKHPQVCTHEKSNYNKFGSKTTTS